MCTPSPLQALAGHIRSKRKTKQEQYALPSRNWFRDDEDTKQRAVVVVEEEINTKTRL